MKQDKQGTKATAITLCASAHSSTIYFGYPCDRPRTRRNLQTEYFTLTDGLLSHSFETDTEEPQANFTGVFLRVLTSVTDSQVHDNNLHSKGRVHSTVAQW